MIYHPKRNDHGKQVPIDFPHTPTPMSSWSQAEQSAIVVPDGPMPDQVNGVPIQSWSAPSTSSGGWGKLAQSPLPNEPPFQAKGQEPAAGAVVVEPDGRIWIVAPTNEFVGTITTFPKGKTQGLGLQATAIKEVYEESGLQVELFSHLVDISRTTSRTRSYLARRLGGNPADMDWETQAVLLAPVGELKGLLNLANDQLVLEALLDRWRERASWFPPSLP